MTTRGRGRRVTTAGLERLIQRELRTDRDISARNIGRRLRAQGVSVGNERLRAITRLIRAGVSATPTGVIANVAIFATERQTRAAMRATGGDVAPKATGQYAQIRFTASATIPYVLHGKADTLSVAVQGTRIFPVPYNPALLREQASRMLGGAAMERLGDLPTDGPVMGEYGHFDADVSVESVRLV